MKTLYKKDTKGKIRVLKLYTKGSKLFQESGMMDDMGNVAKPIIHEKICKPKNVGKSNATTAEEQAIAEMNAKYDIKITEGYFVTQKEAETEEVLLPMLAKSHGDHKDKIDYDGDVFIQPKLDGMRCLAIVKDGNVTLMSRKGKTIETMDHLCKELKMLSNVVLDGELYAHGKSFQENMKLIKKYRPGESEEIKYHVYDIVQDKPFTNRYASLSIISSQLGDNINLVSTMRLTNENGITPIHSRYLSEGYEGSIIRHGDAPYKVNGRSDNLLKYKDFKDVACTIVDIEPAEQRPQWGVPVLEYNGQHFRAGTKMSHGDREQLLINKNDYIGEIAEIRYFEETDDGLPRFPVMVGVRIDK